MRQQRGGFAIGLVVGLLIGLALSLGVALYVTKVPVPFINKVPPHSAAEDAAQAEKNRNWDPNDSLKGAPAPPATSASGTLAPPPMLPPPVSSASPDAAAEAALARRLPPPPPGTAGTTGGEPFTYFVQAGAYSRTQEAEQQRARLGMLGFAARVTEREQAGRTVYRVRVGPFEHKAEADAAKERLDGSGIEAALVRVQK